MLPAAYFVADNFLSYICRYTSYMQFCTGGTFFSLHLFILAVFRTWDCSLHGMCVLEMFFGLPSPDTGVGNCSRFLCCIIPGLFNVSND